MKIKMVIYIGELLYDQHRKSHYLTSYLVITLWEYDIIKSILEMKKKGYGY